jgi:lipopolysaccharide export system permease protein
MMRTLTRYLLRLHVAPFFFALTGLTLLLLLDQVSKRFGQLVGKGLHWTIIGEVFLYSIPFIVAQTFPMAVLVAVLYVFNLLAGDSEITAMKASGIPVSRLVVPLLVVATALAAGMTLFNNTILPESNHRLQMLLTSIGQKKPTFQLREQAINEVLPTKLYVQVVRIDRMNSELEDVVIYDRRAPNRLRTIYAEGAGMAYGPAQTDLYLTLNDGTVQELMSDRPNTFQQTRFDQLIMRVEDVTNQLERDTIGWRSDREMTIGQMEAEVAKGRVEAANAKDESLFYARAITQLLTEGRIEEDKALADEGAEAWAEGLEEAPAEEPLPDPRGSSATDEADTLEFARNEALADTLERADAPTRGPPSADSSNTVDSITEEADGEALLSDAARLDSLRSEAHRLASLVRLPGDAANQFDSYDAHITNGQRTVNKFGVEIHKKYTIPAACIVFVLIGAPIAVRYPRGGVALVVAVSLLVFSAFYVGLVGGEELADNQILSPFWAMWSPNILFGMLGIGLLWFSRRAGRWSGR